MKKNWFLLVFSHLSLVASPISIDDENQQVIFNESSLVFEGELVLIERNLFFKGAPLGHVESEKLLTLFDDYMEALYLGETSSEIEKEFSAKYGSFGKEGAILCSVKVKVTNVLKGNYDGDVFSYDFIDIPGSLCPHFSAFAGVEVGMSAKFYLWALPLESNGEINALKLLVETGKAKDSDGKGEGGSP
ncbi:MAG: hypothetical protein Q7Q71_06465 [Verrucomicrobiota bacterium JB023]|nr:hypothetical protein [Verrucomicrobiota bacterium JB023]